MKKILILIIVLLASALYFHDELKQIISPPEVTIDMRDDNPDSLDLYVLRSFGQSFFHSISDACLEFGYKID